jgi:ABC-type sugar transport system permease subunit
MLIVIYIWQDAGSSGAIGYADKAIEVLLIIVLLVLLVQKPKPKPTAQ